MSNTEKSPGSIDRGNAIFKSLSQSISAPISQKVVAAFHEIMEHPSDASALQAIGELQELFGALNYEDYRGIESALQDARRGHDLDLHKTDRQELSLSMRRIYELLEQLAPSSGEQSEFATSAILLLRMSFPLGKNIVNPSMDPDRGPLGMDAQKVCTINHGQLSVRLLPDGESTAVEIGDKHVTSLAEGQCILLGRSLAVSELFGVKLPMEMTVPVALPIEGHRRDVSRAGIMVTRSGGKLYIFDRGAWNPVLCTQGAMSVSYDPTQRGEDGKLGHSQISYKKLE